MTEDSVIAVDRFGVVRRTMYGPKRLQLEFYFQMTFSQLFGEKSEFWGVPLIFNR